MIQIIIKNELRNGKREPPKERGWCVCVWGGGGGGGGGREARSYMQKKTNESKPEDLSTTNA